jgi:hypothetical protein
LPAAVGRTCIAIPSRCGQIDDFVAACRLRSSSVSTQVRADEAGDALAFGTNLSGLPPARAVSYSGRKWVALVPVKKRSATDRSRPREIAAAEVAAAHVDADNHVGRGVGHAVIDGLDIEVDKPVGVLSRARDLLADSRVAQHGDSDLVELDVAAAGLGQVGYFLPVDGGKVGEECSLG